jgi:predicted amidohydrolase
MRVAAIQMTSQSKVPDNLEQAAHWSEVAVSQGAALVTLPENFAFMGPEHDRLALAETLPAMGGPLEGGPIGRWLTALARLHRIDIVASGMPERGPDDAHTFNTSVHVTPDGTLQASYRKIHLFDVDLADGTQLCESRSVAPGEEPVVTVIDRPGAAPIRTGLAICYDVRFPELFRAMGEMRVVVLGAAFTVHTGRDHWLTLLRARAIENQVYVIAPAQWGAHDSKRASFGRSAIIDPWGTVLAQMPDRPGAIVAELDFAAQDEIRRRLPALQHLKLGSSQ